MEDIVIRAVCLNVDDFAALLMARCVSKRFDREIGARYRELIRPAILETKHTDCFGATMIPVAKHCNAVIVSNIITVRYASHSLVVQLSGYNGFPLLVDWRINGARCYRHEAISDRPDEYADCDQNLMRVILADSDGLADKSRQIMLHFVH